MSRHFLHVFSTFAPGGPEVRAAQLMDRLAADRHTILAMDGKTECVQRLADPRRAELLPAPPPGGFWAHGRWFQALLKRLRPDLLLTYNWGAIEAVLGARLARFGRVVHHEDGFGEDEVGGLLLRRIWARRVLLRGVRRLIVPSALLLAVAKSRWKQPDGRVRHLPNGVDLQRYHPAEDAPVNANPDHGANHDARHGANHDANVNLGAGPAPSSSARASRRPLVIGSVASFRPVKNQAMLIEAFAQARLRESARLVLFGDGPDRPACEQLAQQLGLSERVRFAGAISDTAPVYRELDVFALSSRTEQMPLVVLEAMASGLPVAAPAVGDVEQMVCDRNRPFIVPFVEPSALAVALDALLADADLRVEIGRANRARCAQEFELEACLHRYLRAYDEAASGS